MKCVMDADKGIEKCDRQLERAPLVRHWVSREVHRRRWISAGEDSIVLDTLHSRVVISHCQTWPRDAFTVGEERWRASRRTTGLVKLSEQVLFSAADGRSSATPTSGPPEEIQNLLVGGSVVPMARIEPPAVATLCVGGPHTHWSWGELNPAVLHLNQRDTHPRSLVVDFKPR